MKAEEKERELARAAFEKSGFKNWSAFWAGWKASASR